jgi:hypothetical protein
VGDKSFALAATYLFSIDKKVGKKSSQAGKTLVLFIKFSAVIQTLLTIFNFYLMSYTAYFSKKLKYKNTKS